MCLAVFWNIVEFFGALIPRGSSCCRWTRREYLLLASVQTASRHCLRVAPCLTRCLLWYFQGQQCSWFPKIFLSIRTNPYTQHSPRGCETASELPVSSKPFWNQREAFVKCWIPSLSSCLSEACFVLQVLLSSATAGMMNSRQIVFGHSGYQGVCWLTPVFPTYLPELWEAQRHAASQSINF